MSWKQYLVSVVVWQCWDGWISCMLKLDVTRRLYPSVVAPVMLGLVYAYLMLSFQGEAPAEGGFGTLEEVKRSSVDAPC